MTWRFSRPASHKLLACSLLALALATTGGTLRAQAPLPTPKPGPTRSPIAHIRFWNLLPPPPNANTAPASSFVELQLLPGEGQTALASAGPGSYEAGYAPMRPGAYTLLVRRSGTTNPTEPVVARLPANLRDGSYVTILASESSGRPTAELIDDTPDPKALTGAPGRLTVRQFIPGARVSVLADQRVPSGDLAYCEARSLDGLPTRIVPLTMQSRPAAGGVVPPRTWSTEVDFSGPVRHATLLVVSDPYGRFRPRVAYDGPGPEALAEAAKAIGPTSPSVTRQPSPSIPSPAPR